MTRSSERVRVEIELTREQVEIIDEAVHSGQFPSRAEAIGDAIHDWNLSRHIPIPDEILKNLWDEGIASGDFQPAEEVFQRLRERIAKRLEDK